MDPQTPDYTANAAAMRFVIDHLRKNQFMYQYIRDYIPGLEKSPGAGAPALFDAVDTYLKGLLKHDATFKYELKRRHISDPAALEKFVTARMHESTECVDTFGTELEKFREATYPGVKVHSAATSRFRGFVQNSRASELLS